MNLKEMMAEVAINATLGEICREWLEGCEHVSLDDPASCDECTKSFLADLKKKANEIGVPVGVSANASNINSVWYVAESEAGT